MVISRGKNNMNKNVINKIIVLLLLIVSLDILVNTSVYAFSQIEKIANVKTYQIVKNFYGFGSLSVKPKHQNLMLEKRSIGFSSGLSDMRAIKNMFGTSLSFIQGTNQFIFLFEKQNQVGESHFRDYNLFPENRTSLFASFALINETSIPTAPDSLTITATASSGGTIDPSGLVRVRIDENITFQITPDEGHYITGVYVDNTYVDSTTSYTFINVISDQSIHAEFAINQYTITSSAGANGTISPLGVVNMNYGSSQQFIITPDEGYHIGAVYVDDIYVDSTTSYTFNNITANHTIRGVFAINQYTITSSAGANGTITPLGIVNVNYGANQQFTIIPNTGYHVDSVIVDGVQVDSTTSYTFNNVTMDHTISVRFTVDIPVTNIKVLLQGIYLSGMMQSTLQGLIPLAQPYNLFPWNYSGTESVISMPDSIVDWVLIELRTGPGLSTKVATRAALLKQNGLIMDTDGGGPVKFSGIPIGNYYVVIRHRNHLAVMSATSLNLTAASDLYDFTISPANYYGNDAKSLGLGKYAMYAGDYSEDGFIDSDDFIGPDNEMFLSGYRRADIDMNGFIDSDDFIHPDNNVFKGTHVPN